MAKNSSGHTRHSLPGSSMSNSSKLSQEMASGGIDMGSLAMKKRGPGRPPKSQMLSSGSSSWSFKSIDSNMDSSVDLSNDKRKCALLNCFEIKLKIRIFYRVF